MSPNTLRSTYRELTPDPQVCDRCLSAIEDEDLPMLSYLGLILIPPETFALGIARELTLKVQASGFLPVGFTLRHRLTPREIADSIMLPQWSHKHYFVRRRFSAGPTAAVLVTHLGDVPAGDLLKRRKGHALRGVSEVGTWRCELPVINGILNLVHTADDPAQVIYCSKPFFSAEMLACSARDVRLLRHGVITPGTTWDSLRRSLAARDRKLPGCRPFIVIYLQLLRRLLVRSKIDVPVAHVTSICGELDAVAQDHETGIVADWSRTVRIVNKVAWLEPLCERPMRSILRRFTRFQDLRLVNWRTWISRVEDAGVRLHKWEKLVLITTLYYADREIPFDLLASGGIWLDIDHPHR